MAKANKNQASRRTPRAGRGARGERPAHIAASRAVRQRADRESEKAVPAIAAAHSRPDGQALTRVTHETEVRGTETRIERLVERTSKPTISEADRAAGRGRYVY